MGPGRRKLLDRKISTRAAALHAPATILRGNMSFVVELLGFIREQKKFWLLPILFALVLLGGLLVATKGTAIAPFIYAIF
jgi:hypothetical protein